MEKEPFNIIETTVKLLGVSKNSYWNYRKQKRPVMFLLEKYFTKEDLQEFLYTGRISKFEEGVSYFNLEIDQATFSVKTKLQNVIEHKREWINGKEPVQILQDVLGTIKPDEIKLETAKDVLIGRIKGYEAGFQGLSFAKFLNVSLSKIECYAICKHSDIVFDMIEEVF